MCARASAWALQVPVALVHEVLSLQPKTSEMAKRYDNYALRSFVEDNRAMVWCVGEAQKDRACMFSIPLS